MSATPPTALEGTQSPSQVELLWDRYRSLFYVVVFAVLLALGGLYVWKFYTQKQIDREWSAVANGVGLHKLYDAKQTRYLGLPDLLQEAPADKLEAALAAATDAQRPLLLIAAARKAMMAKQWDRAEAMLKELETKYPKHSLVSASDHPIQARERIPQAEDETKPPQDRKKPELKPAVKGSAVSLMREQIKAASTYQAPSQFAPIEWPKDGPKVKFELSDHGHFVLQLLPEKAPVHVKHFLALVDEKFWEGIAVDEIRRPSKSSQQARELHIGFLSTKGEDDRTKWNETDPAKTLLDFEANDLSHFPLAVSARGEADGKSSAERFWINLDDSPRWDGERVIFAHVVEGQENLARVCEATMSAQEEEQGRGKPSTTIRVTSVTKL